MPRPTYSYGEPNWDLVSRWLHLPPEEDGPFWALNLMQYREVADYGDDGAPDGATRSGKEADDAYAPLGPLAAIGAMVALHGDVTDQRAGDPAWHRVGIVRYPTRAAFFEMQQRDDFKAQHVHKEAGMAFTIVMACQPDGAEPDADGWSGDGRLVLVVSRGEAADAPVAPVAGFDVEGVIVGDDRTFDRAWFARVDDDELAALDAWAADADEAHVLVLEPEIDALVTSVVTAGEVGA